MSKQTLEEEIQLSKWYYFRSKNKWYKQIMKEKIIKLQKYQKTAGKAQSSKMIGLLSYNLRNNPRYFEIKSIYQWEYDILFKSIDF